MLASDDVDIRKRLGERIRAARQTLPEDKRIPAWFCERIRVTPSSLAQIEAGERPVPVDVVYRIAELTGVTLHDLLNQDDSPHGIDTPAFGNVIQFLQEAQKLGVKAFRSNRLEGLIDLTSFLDRMYKGQICITGSSLKGLREDAHHPFVTGLARLRNQRPGIQTRVILTHPLFGGHREDMEARPKNSIVSEIFDGIEWCIRDLGIPQENIKLAKAAPTLFTIFVENEAGDGVGIVNPYPLMRQAYQCLTMSVEYVRSSQTGRHDHPSVSQSIFKNYLNSNFLNPWADDTGNITVNVERAIEECLAVGGDDAEFFHHKAAKLRSFLVDQVREKKPDRPASPGTDEPGRKKMKRGEKQRP